MEDCKVTTPLLSIQDLYATYEDALVLRGVSLEVQAGEILGVVGESGSGKTTTIHAAMGILGEEGRIVNGAICYGGQNLLSLSAMEMRSLRGRELALISQNPVAAFHPIRTIGSQLNDLARSHNGITRKEAEEKMLGLLARMNLKDGKSLLSRYAFELSGGMCQRVSIAMAMVLEPKLLFADEPTSALDVSAQAQVIEELLRLREDFGTAVVMVSHNMGVVSRMAQKIAIMHAGMVLECGKKEDVLQNPLHPYTRNLIRAIPKLGSPVPCGIQTFAPSQIAKQCPMEKACKHSQPVCKQALPPLKEYESGHWSRCHEVERLTP